MESLKKIGWKLISCIWLMLLFVSFELQNPNPVYSAAEVEPNDSYLTATPLTLNGSGTGTLGYTTDTQDWWSFTIAQDGAFKISLAYDNTLGFSEVGIYDSNGSTRLYNLGVYGSPYTSQPMPLGPGTYYIRLLRSGSSNGGYTLSNNFAPQPLPNDNEPNNNYSSAQQLDLDASDTGRLGYYQSVATDTEDWWSFTIAQDGAFKISLAYDNTLGFSEVGIYDSNGATRLYNLGVYGSPYTSQPMPLGPGTYYIRLLRSGSSYGGYTVADNFVPQPLQNDNEPNNNYSSAQQLIPNVSDTGRLGYYQSVATDTEDWWSFTLVQADTVTISLAYDNTLDFSEVGIYDSNGATRLYNLGVYGSPYTSQPMAFGPGTYYIRLLRSGSSYGGYTIKVLTTPTTTTTTQSSISTTSIVSTTTTAPSSTSTTSITSTSTTAHSSTSTTSMRTSTTTTSPSCGAITPSNGAPGDVVDLIIKGNNTHFDASTKVAFDCSGISVASLTINSATEIKVNVLIANNAPEGKCDITVQTGSEIITCADAFEINGTLPITVYEHITTKPQPSSDCTTPSSVTEFSTQDGAAYLWFSYGNGQIGSVIEVQWYSPDFALYDSGSFNLQYADGCVWGPLDINGSDAANKPGEWRVEIYYNGSKLFTNNFTITKPKPIFPCLASVLLADDPESLNLLREFRDTVLAKSEKGKAFIKLYYKKSPEVVEALEKNPQLKDKCRSILKSLIPVIRMMVKSENTKKQ